MLKITILLISVFSVFAASPNGNFLESGPPLEIDIGYEAASEGVGNGNTAMENEISLIFSNSQNEMNNLLSDLSLNNPELDVDYEIYMEGLTEDNDDFQEFLSDHEGVPASDYSDSLEANWILSDNSHFNN